MHLKAGLTWRILAKLPRLEVCFFMSAAKFIPDQAAFLDMARIFAPNLPFNCPILRGNYSLKNYMLMDWIDGSHWNEKMELWRQLNILTYGSVLPNGIYKSSIQVSTDDDLAGIYAEFRLNIRLRMGEDDF
jgi:hypothetical protein